MASALAALVVLFLGLPIARFGRRMGWQFMASSGSLPVIATPPALTGGITLALGIGSAVLIFPALHWPAAPLIGAVILLLAGQIHDRFTGADRIQVIAVLLVALIVALTTNRPGATSAFAFPGLETLVGVVVLAVAITVFQLSDRADGLTDGLALIACVGIIIASYVLVVEGDERHHLSRLAPLLLVLTSMLMALSLYTWRHSGRRHSIVMLGSGGAMMLGLLTGWLALQTQTGLSGSTIGPGMLAWLFTIPLFDAGVLLLRALTSRKSQRAQIPFRAVHLLQAQIVSRRRSVATLLALGWLLAIGGVAAWSLGVPDAVLLVAWLLLFAAHATFTLVYWHRRSATPGPDWTRPESDDSHADAAQSPAADR